jgi:hypothetical protein
MDRSFFMNARDGASYGEEHQQLSEQFQDFEFPSSEAQEVDEGGAAVEIVTTTVDIPLFLVG